MTEQEAWELFNRARKDEDSIRNQIDEIFQETPDRDNALEKIISELFAEHMKKAVQKSNRIFNGWFLMTTMNRVG